MIASILIILALLEPQGAGGGFILASADENSMIRAEFQMVPALGELLAICH